MKNSTTNLSAIGFNAKYYITIDGNVINQESNKTITANDKKILKLQDQKNKFVSVSLKRLYRQVFGKEYCIDTVENLQNEEWIEVQNTEGRYFISNCGRVKSLCNYKARILRQHKNSKGYFYVSINNRKQFVHRLVAVAFVQPNESTNEELQVHHKDHIKENNNANNLEWLSIIEHRKQHEKENNQKETKNTNIALSV